MISENNIRFLITISKLNKKKLEELAKQENRSLNNLIDTIINKYLESQP